MNDDRNAHELRRCIRDFLLSLAVFVALFAVPYGGQGNWAPPKASAADIAVVQWLEPPPGLVVEFASISALPRPAGYVGGAERTRAMILLGLTFSLMLTFNLAIWRHLRREYASPRRGVWGRGR